MSHINPASGCCSTEPVHVQHSYVGILPSSGPQESYTKRDPPAKKGILEWFKTAKATPEHHQVSTAAGNREQDVFQL